MENASTNRIVARSGISKGSFYQYFEDKRDLFTYLLGMLEREKMEYFKDKHPPRANLDTFDYFRWVIKTGMEFNASNVHHTQAISRVLLGEGLYYGSTFPQIRERSALAFRKLIEQAMTRRELNPSIEMELAVTIMETWSNAISNYILTEGMKQKDIVQWVRSAGTQARIDKFLYAMENGLRSTESRFAANEEERE